MTNSGSRTILLAEDEEMLRRLLARCLTESGYRVLEACDGEQALGAAVRDRAIDLLLTDIRMPGISGIELAERLCAGRPELKILFISGYLKEAELPAGAPFLGKPFTPRELLKKVRRILKENAINQKAVKMRNL